MGARTHLSRTAARPQAGAAVSPVALPRRQRAMVVLRYYEGLSEAETAQALGVCAGTVKSSTSRALRSLRTAVSADGEAAVQTSGSRSLALDLRRVRQRDEQQPAEQVARSGHRDVEADVAVADGA